MNVLTRTSDEDIAQQIRCSEVLSVVSEGSLWGSISSIKRQFEVQINVALQMKKTNSLSAVTFENYDDGPRKLQELRSEIHLIDRYTVRYKKSPLYWLENSRVTTLHYFLR